MPGPLDDYAKKRDFSRTKEPEASSSGEGPDRRTFVVHRHEARALHYDLRLEMGGVLRSWAVPRGFSYLPSDKRLAVRTEDHPLAYEHFHGVIPKGQYGGGTMTIWDRGRYEEVERSSELAPTKKGELKVRLFGRKLRGEWHLVETDPKQKHWLLFKSRDRYAGPATSSVLGIDLSAAPQASLPSRPRRMEVGERAEPFSDPAYAFEMQLVGERLFLEKRLDHVRARGARSGFWTERGAEEALLPLAGELRGARAENALIDGVLTALDERGRPSLGALEQCRASGDWGALLFYAFDLLYFDEFDLRPLPLLERKAGLRALLASPRRVLFHDHVLGSGAELVRAVAAAGLPGVVAKRCQSPYRAGPSADWRSIEVPTDSTAQELALARALEKDQELHSSLTRAEGTNLEKVYWPAEGYTKGDLLAYYERVADWVLPYLHERPLHLNRFPDGIQGKSFYQKDAADRVPDWIPTEAIESSGRGEAIRYVICNDRRTLLGLVNLGSIDLHPWLSRRGSLDSPDWAVIDLDPKEASFRDVVAIARSVGRLLRGIGLRPLLKTSGASGLHVFVPLKPGYTYDQTRMFCEGVARYIVREHPSIATVERGLSSSRDGKVYVDFLQNRRGQTIVPPYVVRPVPGATVSTPLDWDELERDLSPAFFTLRTLPPRLDAFGDLFRPALSDGQDLVGAAQALSAMVAKS